MLFRSVPPGAIVGVIGPNGAGKSTTFRMITGQEKPASGTVTVGPTVKLAYVDQSRDTLEGNKTVWEFISGGNDILQVGKFEMPSRAYCGRFNFKGTDQQKKVGNLSGGERGRLHLAKTLAGGGNVLLNVRFEDRPGDPRPALIRALQFDPVTERLIHVDLQQISMDREITVREIGRAHV